MDFRLRYFYNVRMGMRTYSVIVSFTALWAFALLPTTHATTVPLSAPSPRNIAQCPVIDMSNAFCFRNERLRNVLRRLQGRIGENALNRRIRFLPQYRFMQINEKLLNPLQSPRSQQELRRQGVELSPRVSTSSTLSHLRSESRQNRLRRSRARRRFHRSDNEARGQLQRFRFRRAIQACRGLNGTDRLRCLEAELE